MQFELRGSQTARKWSNLIFIKLISAKGSHTGFDATGAQSNEEEAHHGQRAGRERKRADEQNAVAENGEKTKKKKETIFGAGLHVKGHVVRLSVPVGVSDVGDGADRHGDLA